ncbi:hypothetical protein FSP39_013298 [Pinctada imbricata]|uniref:Daxx histone-binding domain-containing protein n=1 Tax=Pinctada imbricata TaxID=66713 RepID=A0AA88XM72_PINIB|nr:hypothetical protein FSP39_013298 [Pinctada imbricata]
MRESVNKSFNLKEDKDKNNSHYEDYMEVNNAVEQASYSGSTSTQDITLHTNNTSDITEEMETSFSGSASTPDFKHQVSNSDIEKKRDDHSDIEKERGGHSDTDKKREGHSEFDKKREGHSDNDKKKEDHSDTDKKKEGHSEAEKKREGHSDTDKKREGHSDTDKKREGHSDTDKKREDHSEAEKKREGHSEAEKKEEKQETKERKKGSKGQIRKLEKLLEDIKDKIEELKQREVSLDEMDDDDSAYIMEDRYQKKFVKVWNKLCEVKGRTPKTGRPSEKKFTYSGTRFPEINRKIESFINKTKKFPDFHDIRQVITKVNHRCKLGMRSSAVEKEAREVFTDVGDKLQRRRQADLLVTFGGHLTNTSDLRFVAY